MALSVRFWYILPSYSRDVHYLLSLLCHDIIFMALINHQHFKCGVFHTFQTEIEPSVWNFFIFLKKILSYLCSRSKKGWLTGVEPASALTRKITNLLLYRLRYSHRLEIIIKSPVRRGKCSGLLFFLFKVWVHIIQFHNFFIRFTFFK